MKKKYKLSNETKYPDTLIENAVGVSCGTPHVHRRVEFIDFGAAGEFASEYVKFCMDRNERFISFSDCIIKYHLEGIRKTPSSFQTNRIAISVNIPYESSNSDFKKCLRKLLKKYASYIVNVGFY